MNTKTSSLLFACLLSCTAYAAPVTVLENKLDIGPVLNCPKKLLINAYSFSDNSSEEPTKQSWFAVFPHEKNLIFLIHIENQFLAFPITHIISTKPNFEVTINPTADNSLTPSTATPPQNNSALITLKIRISPDLQILKDFAILLAKGNTQTLATFVETYSIERIDSIISQGLLCQGQCYFKWDDEEALAAIIEAKKPLSAPISFTGEYTLVPAEVILSALENEATQLANEQAE